MDRPLVSVVITTKNRSGLVREAIESALCLDRQGFELEIVVVDDGSTDDTPQVLVEYPVEVVRTRGVGIAGARNIGVSRSTGDFVQVLDDDDVLLPQAMTSRLRAFTEHPEFGAVHGKAQRTDPDLRPFGEPIPEGPRSSGWVLEDLLCYFPQIGTVLTRREVYSEVGGFHPAFEGDDEWDMFLKTAWRWPIGRIDEAVMLFRQRGPVAEEEQQWRRTAGEIDILRTNTLRLPFVTRCRLRTRFWKVRGLNAWTFVGYALINWHEGARYRAFKSIWYACRWSPVHTVVSLLRFLRPRQREQFEKFIISAPD